MCEVWTLAGFLFGMHQGSKGACVSAHTNRPVRVTDDAHMLKGGRGWVSKSDSPHFIGMISDMEIIFPFYWLNKLQNHFSFKLNMLPKNTRPGQLTGSFLCASSTYCNSVFVRLLFVTFLKMVAGA